MKMKRFCLIPSVFAMVVFLTLGCSQQAANEESEAEETGQFVQISQQQFENQKMEIGEATIQPFEDVVKCNGFIAASPDGIAQISAPLAGIIATINCSPGDKVNKSQVLCTLSSNEFIILQQEFAESSAIHKRLKADYDRSKALFNEKIGAEKDFIAIESEYKAMTTKLQSLKLRLKLLNLDIEKIEKGEFYTTFPVLAPIGGNITSHNILLGQFVEQQKILFEIIDVSRAQLQLSVFENQISKLKTGQKIVFNTSGSPGSVFDATLVSIGKTINQESRSILCIAKIYHPASSDFINHSYIEASIITDATEAKALPSDAIIKTDGKYYVFVVQKSENQNYYLQKVQIKIGRVSDKFTEIIEGESLQKVVIRGVYNLPTE